MCGCVGTEQCIPSEPSLLEPCRHGVSGTMRCIISLLAFGGHFPGACPCFWWHPTHVMREVAVRVREERISDKLASVKFPRLGMSARAMSALVGLKLDKVTTWARSSSVCGTKGLKVPWQGDPPQSQSGFAPQWPLHHAQQTSAVPALCVERVGANSAPEPLRAGALTTAVRQLPELCVPPSSLHTFCSSCATC